MFGADSVPRSCPCGTGRPYAACCAPFVEDGLAAPSAEQLMRSRYTAYALGRTDHVFRTWHPATRPADVEPDSSLQWEGLTVRDVVAGSAGDSSGVVEFEARWRVGGQRGALAERSTFARRGGRWVYVGPENPEGHDADG